MSALTFGSLRVQEVGVKHMAVRMQCREVAGSTEITPHTKDTPPHNKQPSHTNRMQWGGYSDAQAHCYRYWAMDTNHTTECLGSLQSCHRPTAW